MSGVYTCNSCSLGFDSSQDQRDHMKTEWHRYNLKRRVAQLPAISELVFNTKVRALSQAESEDDARKRDEKKQLTKKEIRRREKEALLEKKKKLLALAQENYLKNKALAENQAQKENTEAEKEVKEEQTAPVVTEENVPTEEAAAPAVPDEELTEEQLAERLMNQKLESKVDIPLETCLFCTNESFKDFETNLDHMFKNHGFYIPEQKFLTDKEGLVHYLSEKIGLGNMCIVCNYQGRSLEAVRAHMLAKRHCKIPYESENERLEISEFYDFTASYAGYAENTKKTQEPSEVVADDGNDEWEDVSSDEENAEATEDNDEDEDDLPDEYLYNDGTELHLPTGVKVGHRSLQRYYKQNLKPERILTEGQGTLVAAETRTFLPAFDKQKYNVKQRAWKSENMDKKREDKRHAKFVNNQPYYRDQLLQ
ncbi:Rei1 protein [Maudiozyma humilis]|uniref:Rei1 protein n=1 Tax=Maudiozyma humilis TaxID=51915 RepID=A0AAV5RTB6_MAUHU|nr:Rei1 protein [Kazachstania humilis]